MKRQLISVFESRKSVHYWWSYISFAPECKELTCMLDPLLFRWDAPPVVIRCVHWTMQKGVMQTWIIPQSPAIVMLNENVSISIKISSLKFVPQGSINNISALVQMMAWRWPGNKPLSELMMVRLPMHICVTRPQWVNSWKSGSICQLCPRKLLVNEKRCYICNAFSHSLRPFHG